MCRATITPAGNRVLLALLLCGGMVLLAIPVLAMLIVPNVLRARAETQLSTCQANLKRMATAVETYGADHRGQFPKTLDGVAALPTCPTAGTSTYAYRVTAAADAYTVLCEGNHHAATGIPRDHPRFDSSRGLVSR